MANVRRVQRDRHLTPEEKAKYRAIRAEVEPELPELAAAEREHPSGPQGWEDLAELKRCVAELRAERERQGLDLAEAARRSRLYEAELADLEAGRDISPALHVLSRYARALGRCLRLSLGEDDDAARTARDAAHAE